VTESNWPDADFTERLRELRRVFDEGFASPPQATIERGSAYLEVGTGENRVLVDLEEVAVMEVRRKIVSLPGTRRAFLGLAGIRGKLVPVFDLGQLLGYETSSGAGAWVLVSRSDRPLGLAVESFHGLREVRPEERRPAESLQTRHFSAVVPGDWLRPVLNMASLLAEIIPDAKLLLRENP
jgi:chemotaxis signal transduction protein